MKYEWVAEQRMVPGVGEPKEGDIIDISEDLGASLAAQGLCKPVASKITVKAKED